MDRRNFMAGCASLALSAKAGAAFAQSGPLTRIVFPFAAGGGGDALCRILGAAYSPRCSIAMSLSRTAPAATG